MFRARTQNMNTSTLSSRITTFHIVQNFVRPKDLPNAQWSQSVYCPAYLKWRLLAVNMICFVTSLAKHKFAWLSCPLAHLLTERNMQHSGLSHKSEEGKTHITPHFISGMSVQISGQAQTLAQKPTHEKFSIANQVSQFSTDC